MKAYKSLSMGSVPTFMLIWMVPSRLMNEGSAQADCWLETGSGRSLHNYRTTALSHPATLPILCL
jgi:hypothetical protein